MKGKSGGLWKTFFIFCLVVLINQWLATAQNEQESQKLRDFRAHVNKHYNMQNIPADQYCTIYGFIFRLQWDKVMNMPDSEEKQLHKQYLEQLWWDLRDFAFREGEKWKKQGVWDSGGEGMFQQFKGGFEMLGKTGQLTQEDLQKLGGQNRLNGLIGIPSMFEKDSSGGGDSYDDVSVEALSGRWRIEGTYMSTGKYYGGDTVILQRMPVKKTNGFILTFYTQGYSDTWGRSAYWLLTDDGVIEWVNIIDNKKIQFFRERKNFWSGIAYEGNIGVKLSLYRNK